MTTKAKPYWVKNNWCKKHGREYVKNCTVCTVERIHRQYMLNEVFGCAIHLKFEESCKQCVEYNRYALAHRKIIERQTKFEQALKDVDKHANEKCVVCDKPIIFDEWFCYCCMCPDCYLKHEPDEEEYDKYGDLKEVNL